jgi:hypothetical protein
MKKTQIMILDDNIVGRGQNSYKRASTVQPDETFEKKVGGSDLHQYS